MYKKTCPVCGKEFYNKKSRVRTCSISCGAKRRIKIKGTPFSDKQIQIKCKETMKEKYGVIHITQNKEYLEKAQENQKRNHGGKLAWNTEKSVNTKLEKYGKNYFSNISKLADHTKTDQEKRYRLWKESITKEGKKKTVSKVEQRIYSEMIKIFKEVKTQYYSKLYPFFCDFYIPEIDTYIEYNGDMFHHKKPYDENNKEHQKELLVLKEKAKSIKIYNTIIKTWTEWDPLKRNIAKQNNLNYIEFWKEKDVYRWLLDFINKGDG